MVDLSYKKEVKSPKQDNFQNGFIWIIKGEKSRTRKIKEGRPSFSVTKTNIENTVKSRKSIQMKTDESGKIFGLTHSSVSRRVSIIRQKMALEQNFQKRVEAIKS